MLELWYGLRIRRKWNFTKILSRSYCGSSEASGNLHIIIYYDHHLFDVLITQRIIYYPSLLDADHDPLYLGGFRFPALRSSVNHFQFLPPRLSSAEELYELSPESRMGDCVNERVYAAGRFAEQSWNHRGQRRNQIRVSRDTQESDDGVWSPRDEPESYDSDDHSRQPHLGLSLLVLLSSPGSGTAGAADDHSVDLHVTERDDGER